jgi:hypothetical protein
MEPEVSVPYLQEPATGPYPEPDESSPYHPILATAMSEPALHRLLTLHVPNLMSIFFILGRLSI